MPETYAAAAVVSSSSAATERNHQHRQRNEKGGPKLLSLLLKTLIMSFLTSLFFLFLGLAAIILLHLFLAGRQFHLRDHQSPPRRHHASHHSDFSDSGYSRDDLRKLPRFRYGGGGTVAAKMANCSHECAVCLESFRDDQLCRSLPDCHHVFHLSCIDSWLVKAPACPLCRARVRLSSGGASSSGAGMEQVKHLWTAQS